MAISFLLKFYEKQVTITRLSKNLGTVLFGHFSSKVFKFSPDSKIVEIQGPKRLELSLERDP